MCNQSWSDHHNEVDYGILLGMVYKILVKDKSKNDHVGGVSGNMVVVEVVIVSL